MSNIYEDLTTNISHHGFKESPEVQRLIAQRNTFLSKHPQLKTYQDEIDNLLGTTLDPVIRLEILFILITEKMTDLRVVFEEVMRLAKKAVPTQA